MARALFGRSPPCGRELGLLRGRARGARRPCEGLESYGFDALSDGCSSVIQILCDLMKRMDHDWLQSGTFSAYDVGGVVLIDALETHLHISLQCKILSFLTKFFPRLQFIVSTHSPYILSSISNAKVYDLKRRVEAEDLSGYSADELVEGHFGAEEYADQIIEKLDRYRDLKGGDDLSSDDAAERARLRRELRGIPDFASSEARSMFEDIMNGVARLSGCSVWILRERGLRSSRLIVRARSAVATTHLRRLRRLSASRMCQILFDTCTTAGLDRPETAKKRRQLYTLWPPSSAATCDSGLLPAGLLALTRARR